jgi:hypothetical protein
MSNFMTTNGIVPDVRAGMHVIDNEFCEPFLVFMKVVNDPQVAMDQDH